MANTLTGLIPTIYEAMDIVAREMVGFIPAVFKNTAAERAAKDETIRYPIAPANTAGGNISAGADPADDGDQAIGYADMTISKSRYWPVRLEGEESKGLGNAGTKETIMRDRFAQAIRAGVNEVEADLAALYPYASRAVKTTGLRLFDETDGTESLAEVKRILEDNGAQGQEIHLVLGSAAMARLRSAKAFVQVDRSGSPELLRSGVVGLPLFDMSIHNSAKVAKHTNGTYASAVLTDVALNGTACATTGCTAAVIKAGDLLKFANDTENVYVSQLAGISAGTSLTLNAPGSLVAHSGATDAITPLMATSYYPNMAFARNAIHLVTRLPAMPDEGDSADDAMTVTDPISGLTFEVRMYKQYHRVKYEVCLAWGVKAVKSDFIAILAG